MALATFEGVFPGDLTCPVYDLDDLDVDLGDDILSIEQGTVTVITSMEYICTCSVPQFNSISTSYLPSTCLCPV